VPESFALVFGTPDGGESDDRWQAFSVLLSYVILLFAIFWHAAKNRTQSLLVGSERYAGWSVYVVRFAFWSVFLVGIVDTTISALRIENALAGFIGEDLNAQLGQARFRANNVHYPLLGVSAIIAALTRNLSMIWLAFLVVLAEFSIVLTRFIFSYEQAYMANRRMT